MGPILLLLLLFMGPILVTDNHISSNSLTEPISNTRFSLTPNKKITVDGITLLFNVRPNVRLTTFSSTPHSPDQDCLRPPSVSKSVQSKSHNDTFLGFSIHEPSDRILNPNGTLMDRKFMSIFRFKTWWSTMWVGSNGSDLQMETQLILLQVPESNMYVLLLPIIEGSFRSAIHPGKEGEVVLCVESGSTMAKASCFSSCLYFHVGENPFDLVKDAFSTIRVHLGSFRLLKEKTPPWIVDRFGWCTWDAFYLTVEPVGVWHGVKSFVENGLPPRFLIIDDGWQSINHDHENPFEDSNDLTVPNSIEDGLLGAMNKGQFSIIAIANSSTGFPYSVSLAPNVYSYERDITNPSPENERNMKSSPSLASHEYFADMNNRIEAFGRDKLIINLEQPSVGVVGNAILTTATLNCSEFIGEGDFMEMNTMSDHTYLALLLFTIFCLCCLSIFMTQCFPGKLVDKETIGCHQDVKSKNFISMLPSINTVMLILTTVSAVAANLPYKVSGRFYPHENHTDSKGYYDEPNDKNGRTDVKLKMLIPMINTFHEFVKVDRDPKGNGMTATGFSVDLFKEVMDSLPNRVSYEFFPYESIDSLDMGYYDELILQMHLQRYDGVVGDITITSNRSKSGDFTLPYMMAGVSMIVPIVDDQELSLWWFLKPFTWDLWLLIIALFLSKGLLVWFFERGNNLSFSVDIFFFELWEKPRSKYSILVVILWTVAMFILVGSYDAILQTMLSANNDGPIVTTIEQLIVNEDCVGYQKGSFVFYLLKHMGFQDEKLKAYSSNEEYAMALSRRSCNNGVSAIIEEIPYIKVFLAKYGDRYTMAGPTFGPVGFGFLFQRGCTIVPNVSRIILEFIEGNKMTELEKKWFGSLEPNTSPPKTPQSGRRLTTYDFRGVLLITGLISCILFLIFNVVNKSECGKTMRNLLHNKAVEGSNTEESLSGSHTDGNPSSRERESDQFTANETDKEAGDPSADDHDHINVPPQNIQTMLK